MKRKNIKFPDRKISETFLEFSFPLIDSEGEGITKKRMEEILSVAFTVWNSIVLDAVSGNMNKEYEIMRLTKSDILSSALVAYLIDRKKSLFADDLRLIGEYGIRKKKGQWLLRAEAIDPTKVS